MSVGEPLGAMLRTRHVEPAQDVQILVGDGSRLRDRSSPSSIRRVSERPDVLPPNAIHELRTPLTAIHGYAQMLQRGLADNPRAANGLSVIMRESGRLTSMLTELADLTDLVEPSDPESPSQPSDVDLRELAEIVAETVSSRDAERHEIVVRGQARLSCRRPRLSQALTHVLTNATLYSPAETRIDLTLERGADRVRIYVADEGIGIPEADAERVYRPFERGTNARELGARGLGLGLFIARRALAFDGGRLTHVARPSAGTVFVIDLPRS